MFLFLKNSLTCQRVIVGLLFAFWLMDLRSQSSERSQLPSSLDTGNSISRRVDFEACTKINRRVTSHGGYGAFKTSRWTYGLIENESEKSFPKMSLATPLRQNDSLLYQRSSNVENFNLYDLKVMAEGFSLIWNKSSEFPESRYAGVWLTSSLTIEETGLYSLQGTIKTKLFATAETKGMVFAIAILKKGEQVAEEILRKVPGNGKKDELTGLVRLEAESQLANISLAVGDQLIFAIRGSMANYRGLYLEDSDLKIICNHPLAASSLGAPKENVAGYQLACLLNLEGDELKTVRQLDEQGKYEELLNVWAKKFLLDTAKLPPVKDFYYWLHVPAEADQILKGIVTTKQYGISSNSTVRIGSPGQVNWFSTPEDGYEGWLRDCSTMHWVNKLAEAYQKNPEAKYVKGWQDLWADFVLNWPRQYQDALSNPLIKNKVNGTINWSDRQLYVAWRLDSAMQGLNSLAHKIQESK